MSYYRQKEKKKNGIEEEGEETAADTFMLHLLYDRKYRCYIIKLVLYTLSFIFNPLTFLFLLAKNGMHFFQACW